MDKGLKNTATPITMEEEGLVPAPAPAPEPVPVPVPVPVPIADEESQSRSYAAAGETGIKSKSFLH